MSAPTLINLPPPPSDPVTPSEAGPGTPNSTQTSMSELSTVAIKDGHRGHPHHHHTTPQAMNYANNNPQTNPLTTNLDTERADRISRLPGLERVTTARQNSNISLPPGASASNPTGAGYFDPATYNAPSHLAKERSTVGSASATGSVGGRTTWASGSDAGDAGDNMTEDMETSSVGGGEGSDNNSLVGFGEGASSTVSGPISTPQGANWRRWQRQNMNARMAGLQQQQQAGSGGIGRGDPGMDGVMQHAGHGIEGQDEVEMREPMDVDMNVDDDEMRK